MRSGHATAMAVDSTLLKGTNILFSWRLCPASQRAHNALPLTVRNPVLCATVTVFGAASKILLQGWGLPWRQSRKWMEGKGVKTFSFSTSPHIASLHLAFQREENHTVPLYFIHKEFELIDNGSWRRWRLRLHSVLWVLLHPLYCYWSRFCNFNIRGWL